MKLNRTTKSVGARTILRRDTLSCGDVSSGVGIKIKNQAFTLIELLLGVAIFAIVLMAINTVFYTALRLERSTMRSLDERTTLNHAMAILRRDLLGAVPPISNTVFVCDFISGAGTSSAMGNSRGSSIEFYTTSGVIKDDVPWGDLQRVRYELVEPADRTTRGMDLVRVVTRNVLSTTLEESDRQWLMGNVESVEFLNYDGSSWRESWDTTMGDTGLPTAVRARFLLANTNSVNNVSFNREPLELLVPLVTQSRTSSSTTGGEQ